jgi:hypothetical protein
VNGDNYSSDGGVAGDVDNLDLGIRSDYQKMSDGDLCV